eukprot:5184428-Ditylum_brightwellii.AAC.1
MHLLFGSSTPTQQPDSASPLTPQEQHSLQSNSASELPYVHYTDTDWNKVLHPPPNKVPICTSESFQPSTHSAFQKRQLNLS